MIFAWWLACVSAERVDQEHDQLARASADLLGLSLVVAEWTRHVEATTFRHENACGCPCTEAIGTADSYVNELDYAAPFCVPTSGLLPAATTGHLWLDVDRGELGLDRVQALVADAPAEAELVGEVLDDAGSVAMAGRVAVGATEADIDLELQVDATTLTLVGSATVGELSLALSGVTLPLDQASRTDGCPVVDAGTITTDEGSVTFGPSWTLAWRDHERTDDPCRSVAAFLAE